MVYDVCAVDIHRQLSGKTCFGQAHRARAITVQEEDGLRRA
jgi:hypothetical protein